MNTVRRPRRLRRTSTVRDAVAETRLSRRALIQPLFTCETDAMAGPIAALPGIARETIDQTLRTIERDLKHGLSSFLLFGLPAAKDATGENAVDPEGVTPRAISAIKQRFGEQVMLSVDVCLCPHLDHGHCGFVLPSGEVENDRSAAKLAEIATVYAQAGADVVAPSDMMDGRIGVMRRRLDAAGLENTAILAYSVKYASQYYGPFREAAHSAPAFGDRRAYQMDPRNAREALVEARLDVEEGADMVMVKPALAYLDVIRRVRDELDVPVVAYNVSGEYAAVKLLAERGLARETDLALENLHSMCRAGADLVITYHARELAAAGVIA